MNKKTILLMRHAKSSWEDSSLRDFDRPLNKRGKRDAPRMGTYLEGLGMVPDAIISSPAVRAKQTIRLVSENMGFNPDEITWNEDLYYGGVDAYLEAIRTAPGSSNRILITGHNPMTEQTMGYLKGDTMTQKVSTASIACFEFAGGNWDEINPSNTELKWFVTPKTIT